MGELRPWLGRVSLLREAKLVNGMEKHLDSLGKVILYFFCKYNSHLIEALTLAGYQMNGDISPQ